MRDIKFRAKGKDGWVYGYLYSPTQIRATVTKSSREWYPKKISPTDTESIHDIFPETIGMFAGVTDMNGEEIYEGDILAREWTYRERHSQCTEDFDEITGTSYGVVCFQNSRGFYLGKGFAYSDTPTNVDGEPTHIVKLSHTRLKAYRSQVIGNIYDDAILLQEWKEKFVSKEWQ